MDPIKALMPRFNLYVNIEDKYQFIKTYKCTSIPRVGEIFWFHTMRCEVTRITHEEHPGYPDYTDICVYIEEV